MEKLFKTTGKNMKRWMKTIEKSMQLMETTMNTHGKNNENQREIDEDLGKIAGQCE